MSATVPMSVWNNVRKYFKESLDDRYDLQDESVIKIQWIHTCIW